MTKCIVCNRTLTNPTWIRVGMGQTCASNNGIFLNNDGTPKTEEDYHRHRKLTCKASMPRPSQPNLGQQFLFDMWVPKEITPIEF
jgi:hypothetical protein